MMYLDDKNLILEWEGFYTIKDKELYNENKPGLYLFTVKAEDFYSLHYIGMTTGGLSSRIVGTGGRTGHLRDYVSGRYYIYNFDELKRLNIKTEYNLNDNFETFFCDLEKYQTLARKHIEAVSFLLCPFDSHHELIEIAESLLINHVFAHPKETREEIFPIIDNSKKVSSKIVNYDLTLINRFPGNNTVKGLVTPIKTPYMY